MVQYSTVPTAIVAALVAAHPAARADLAFIRDRHDPSRYQGVYEHVHGQRYHARSYRARVLKFWELGTGFRTADEAARAIVAFYKAHYGTNWQTVHQKRKVQPWRIVSEKRGGCVTGYTADLFVRGESERLNRAGVSVWPSADAAREAIRQEMAERLERESSTLTIPDANLIFWRV